MIHLSASRVAALIAVAFVALVVLISRGQVIDDVPVAPLAALLWLGLTTLFVARWIRRREMERQHAAGDKVVTLLH
jgi:hypothetical protein